jgi:ribonuclease Z
VLGRKVVYSGDTMACKLLFEEARGADLLIHDGTFVEPMEGRAHPSVREVAKLAKSYGVQKLVLTHLSRRYRDTKETLAAAKAIFKNTVVAEDGMRIKI